MSSEQEIEALLAENVIEVGAGLGGSAASLRGARPSNNGPTLRAWTDQPLTSKLIRYSLSRLAFSLQRVGGDQSAPLSPRMPQKPSGTRRDNFYGSCGPKITRSHP